MNAEQLIPPPDPVYELLLERELRALKVLSGFRLLLLVILAPTSYILAFNNFERLSMTAILVIYGIVVAWSAILIQRRGNLLSIGLMGIGLDIIFIALLPVVWYVSVGGSEVPAGFMLKTSITMMALLFIVLNSLAMRPLYPMLVATGAVIVHLALLLISLMDERTSFSNDYLDSSFGPSVSIGRFAVSLLVIMSVGVILTRLATHARRMIIEAAHLEKANIQLARYFSPNLVPKLIENPALLAVGGERRELSFVFTDLADFTSLVETHDPSIVVATLNEYLDEMVRIAFGHDGTVDKIVGDAVHVIFGAPVAQPNHAALAVACAMEMDTFAQAYRAGRAHVLPLGVTRIGVNSGAAVVGNFGGDALFDYTAHGDAVNTAARLEGANKYLGTRICVSAKTVAQIPDFCGRPLGSLLLKGKSRSLDVYEPITSETMQSATNQAYVKAFASLEARQADARTQFASLVQNCPDDPMAAFYLARLEKGEFGTNITLTQK